MRAVAAVLVLVTACGDNVPSSITISAPRPWEPALAELVALTPYGGLTLGEDGAFRVVLGIDETLPREAYRAVISSEATITVTASDTLGAQYGAAAALEALGFRFRHPFDALVPVTPELDTTLIDGAVHAPEMSVRGLQLHTLHPIEGYYAFWEPSPGSTNDAHHIIDWLIKNRGNFLQWVALDDILDADRRAAWQPFTRELIDYAHARGVRVGLNLQLFGQSNLQLAFDLVDADPASTPIATQVAARLPAITDGVPFDVYDLSFGEFFNADPALFIGAVDEVQRQLAAVAPQAEMHAVIHVGAEQVVDYMGEQLLYYFLVKFADPAIVHDVHTTMFYTLFDPTFGAYHHTDFSEHRAYLFDQICAGRKPVYFPETAYWVAFDNSVPQYMPVYVHNRWYDLRQLRDEVPCAERLDKHLLFSSGWEWGYWLHDVTALRASFELPAAPDDLVRAELGRDLRGAVDPLNRLIDLQRTYLHLRNLVPYISGRDVAIDAGRQLDIVSQPDRETFSDLVTEVPADFQTRVMTPLTAYADELEALTRQLDAVDVPAASRRWRDELRDGFAIDRLRARYVLATYGAVLAHVGGDAATAQRSADAAARLLDEARTVVARRHGDLHDTHRRRLVDRSSDENPNRTFYQYGYLYNADTLCFWQRELVQVEAVLGRTSATPPGCLLP